MKPYLNVDLLQKIRDHIAEKPLSFVMGDYLGDDEVSPCGTAACIAGWAVLLGASKDVQADVRQGHVACDSVAMNLLFGGTGTPEDDRATCLFCESDWPTEYRATSGARGGTFPGATGSEQPKYRLDVSERAVRLLDEVLKRGEIFWEEQL